MLAVQNAVDRRHLGSATSTVTFLRSMGGSFGTAVGGAVVANRLSDKLHQIPAASGIDASQLQSAAQIFALPPALRDRVGEAFGSAITTVFLVSVPFILAAFALSLLLPELPLRGASTSAAGSREQRGCGRRGVGVEPDVLEVEVAHTVFITSSEISPDRRMSTTASRSAFSSSCRSRWYASERCSIVPSSVASRRAVNRLVRKLYRPRIRCAVSSRTHSSASSSASRSTAASAARIRASDSSRSASLSDSSPSILITPGRDSPCTTRVKRITQKARKMIRLRPGNGSPASVSCGTASAAASVTAPRMPIHEIRVGYCQGG